MVSLITISNCSRAGAGWWSIIILNDFDPNIFCPKRGPTRVDSSLKSRQIIVSALSIAALASAIECE